MGKKTVSILTCDICGKSSRPEDDTTNWLEWSQDHPFYDRDWIERCACPTCVNDIQVALKKKSK